MGISTDEAERRVESASDGGGGTTVGRVGDRDASGRGDAGASDRGGHGTSDGGGAGASDAGDGAERARARLDRASERVARWRTRGWTTIVLEEGPDGTWRATQKGVATVGHGETAADAAAAYCRRVGDDESGVIEDA